MASQKMSNWLYKRAALTPDRTAVVFKDEEWTFRELNQRAVDTAKRFGQLGVKPGDSVALVLQNGLHTVEILHALEYAGAIIVMLNTRLTSHELAWQLEDSGAAMLVYDTSFADKAQRIAELNPRLTCLSGETLFSTPAAAGPLQTDFDLDAVHTLIYTSGTTGYPKGVMLTYGNHWWSAIGSSLNLGLHAEDRWLACLPMFHVSGLSILMKSVIYGMPVIVHESFDPAAINRSIREDRVTIVSVVSAMLSRLLDELGDSRYSDFFRCMLLGGGPAPEPLLEACRDRGIPVYQTYGLTETASQIVTLAPEYMLSKLGSAGKPLFPAELRIEQDGAVQAAGEVGEIVVKGPNVTTGYFNRKEATQKTIRNGWLYTGDLGYLDQDGFLYVLDRRSDLIISGGENVYPAEVESVLLSHPQVEEAGVTGRTDERWGQVPVAFVTARAGAAASEEEILAFCRERLASYKVPVAIHFVRQLPRNASNKLLRRNLLDLLKSSDG